MTSGNESVATIEMIGDAGRVVVNVSDRAVWEQKGYRVRGNGQAPHAEAPVDFGSFTVPVLKVFAQQAGIQGFDNMRKSELVAALTEVGFVPEDMP